MFHQEWEKNMIYEFETTKSSYFQDIQDLPVPKQIKNTLRDLAKSSTDAAIRSQLSRAICHNKAAIQTPYFYDKGKHT